MRASAPGALVAGLTVAFGEPHSGFGQRACALQLAPGGEPSDTFAPGGPEDFAVAYRFRLRGRHKIRVVVAVDPCDGAPQQQAVRVLVVNVKARGRRQAGASGRRALRAPRAVLARAAQAGCSDTDVVPDRSNTATVADSTVCLINAERAKAGLGPVTRNAALDRSADLHNALMVATRFFSHQGDGEPPLAQRIALVRYPGKGFSENLGWGAGTLATPGGLIVAWMASPLHRANILDPANHEIGISVRPSAPIGAPTPGASYTTNFGTGTSAGPPPKAAAGPVSGTAKLSVSALRLTPRAFRVGAAGAPGVGATLKYRLSPAATVSIVVQQKVAGRRVGRRCLAASAAKSGKRCTRTIKRGTLLQRSRAGDNSVAFTGRVAGRPLPRGTYSLRVLARDSRGRKAVAVLRSFRILRAKR